MTTNPDWPVTFHINYWNGEFHYCIWWVPRGKSKKDQMHEHVADWPIELAQSQLDSLSLDDLKRLYKERIDKAKEGFLARKT